MAIDTPANIVIIGAGPIGIEAALYARFLGYDVQVIEQSTLGARLLANTANAPTKPVKHCCSPLGLRALMAQDPRYTPPELETLWTPAQLVENYLGPVAQTDLLQGLVREHTRVTDIIRTAPPLEESDSTDPMAAELTPEEQEAGWVYEETPPQHPPLRVSVQQSLPASKPPASSLQPPIYYDADIVIDASGCAESGPDYSFLSHLCLKIDPLTDNPAVADAGLAAQLLLPEPNFYILGSKKLGCQREFTISEGLRQIRDLFALIGGRTTLDLYQPLAPA